ncbi:MAG: thiamine phosphate synthase [Lautropia sp.]|nr:thiamine phosphate synthase [Lautropia sp.]
MPLPPPCPRAARIRGIYAITGDAPDTATLLAQAGAALHAGIRLLQYRQKHACAARRRSQLQALQPLCARHQALLIVNDDWQLAAELGLDAVHLGADDGDVQAARQALGPEALIGVSCYASVERARQLAPYADYLAFGALFVSGTKPGARPAPLQVLTEARAAGLGRPLVGIGGITAANLGSVFHAGADAVAVIGSLFGTADVAGAARALQDAAQQAMRSGV